MAETRVQVAYHCKIDPAQLTPGLIRLPEQVTRTISVGAELVTEKVALSAIPEADRAVLLTEIDKQVREATRTARPVGAAAPAASDVGAQHAAPEDEMSAF